MGPPSDPMAVVAEDGQVHGLRGLRVADLSIAPRVVRSAGERDGDALSQDGVVALMRAADGGRGGSAAIAPR